MTTSDGPKSPGRAASAVALVALIAVLVGGGWGAYRSFVKSAPMAVGNDFIPDLPRGAWRARMAATPAQPPQAVVVSPGQVVTVRAGGLVMNATGRPDGSWRLNFAHRGGGAAPDAASVELLNAVRQALASKRPSAELKLTDAQRASLASLVATPPELASAAADRVVEICKQLVKTPAGDAKAVPLKAELEQVVTAAAKGDRNAILAAYVQRAGQVRSILSPEQVQTLTTGGAARPAASARPATKPA